MKKYILFFAILISFAACKEEATTDLNLVFQANMGSEVLEYAKNYQLLDGTAFLITRSDMFLSDITLIDDKGEKVKLADIIQVDFEDSPGGVNFPIKDVPIANYESIKFSIGLNPEVNKTSPVDYPASSPLQNSGYYWDGWNSYIFTKTEGRVDDGSGEVKRGWIFHTGMDPLLRNVTINIDREISSNNNELRIILDHKGLFEKNGAAVSLGITHDPSDLEVLGTFMDRMVTGFSFQK